ncbi:MAG TPA: hypothetical protein VN541_07660, partial [Tepidisphaeraceae bacterium]|nr:hypothetical protein [Tepidisphaeraceae bacterium]
MRSVALFLLAGSFMTALFQGGAEADAQAEVPAATGASIAFTSTDPLIVQARGLMNDGKFAQAEELIRKGRAKDNLAADELLEVMSRIRLAYNMDEAGMLAKLRPVIPDVSAVDLHRWRAAGQVQYRIIDGQVRYFGREPANMFRFCDEAKKRRREAPAENPQWNLEDHLARVIATAQRQGRTDVLPVRHRV